MINKIKEFILDLIFPKTCFGCGKEGLWFCKTCKKEIKLIKTQTCYLCKRISLKGKICSKCKSHSNLSGVVVTTKYEGLIKQSVCALKYEGLSDVSRDLTKLMIKCLKENKLTGDYLVVPIPLHKKKFYERGFNQSELLATEICNYFTWQMSKKLIKIKNTSSQVGQKGILRRKNLKNAFMWRGENITKKNILLVDDVLTTGSTLEEAARVLKVSGAKKIWAIVLSKGDIKSI